jgi:KDO2-lipid IV(A) lauroyltransferase
MFDIESHMIDSVQIEKLKNRLNTLRPTLAGKFFYYCVPFRKKVVLQNMQHVFNHALSEQEILKLAQCFYSHMATSLKENMMMRFMSLQQIKDRAIFKGEEHLRKLIDNDVKGAIIITGHFGNWEFAPIAGILNFPEYQGRFFFVRKLLATKWIEKIVFRRYYQAGLNVIPKKNSLEQVCHALETNNAVVFVMDQHASIKAKDGIMVDFFSKLAGTFRAPAMIARYTNVPILAGRSYRRTDGKHVLEIMPRIEWIKHDNPKEELAINTRQYNKVLEDLILEYPEQWLWMHKRWKTT